LRTLAGIPPAWIVHRNPCLWNGEKEPDSHIAQISVIVGFDGLLGAPDIEYLQHRTIGRRRSRALRDRFGQQALQFAKIGDLRADIVQVVPSNVANLTA